MFSLIVSADSKAWENDTLMRSPAARFGECSGTEAASITTKDRTSLKELERIPTLLMYEIGSQALDVVRYGFVRNLEVTGTFLSFSFENQGFFSRSLVEEFAWKLDIGDYENNRTHWAVKNGDIPRELMSRITKGPYRTFRYEVVLSFAGENRPYVDAVAEYLKKNQVACFYDLHEEATLWGKDLAEELDIIYTKEGRYCVMFVSEHYATKMWPTHERRSAFVRSMEERGDYILPVRFDTTEVPGLRKTIGYIDGNKKTPEELGRLIQKKLGVIE